MLVHSLACCYCCDSIGYGGNCFCYGSVCCAPAWLQNYSKIANGKMPPQFGIQQNMLTPSYVQQGYGQPMSGQPMNGQVMYGQPMNNQQIYMQPMNGQQMYNQPQWTRSDDVTIIGMLLFILYLLKWFNLLKGSKVWNFFFCQSWRWLI